LIRSAGIASVVLATLFAAVGATAPTPGLASGADTTRVTRTLGALRLTLEVAPTPTHSGDSAAVRVRIENHGVDSMRIMEYPCYRDYYGVRTSWVNHEIVCLVGSHERWLAPGAVHTTEDTLSFVDQPGRYYLEYLATADPRVTLRVPIALRGRE